VHLLVNGKRGLTHGVIYIYYASIDSLSRDIGYYCRQIEFKLAITVNASLELVTCDFLSLCDGDKFLVVLEFRNSWINSLSLELLVTEPHESSRLISLLLQSSQTRRVVVALPRILLSSAKSESPIPRKTKSRQFVISESTLKSNITVVRRAWWYRKHILDHLSGTWAEQGSNARKGNVELRGIRLSERHVQVVQRHEVEALVSVLPLDEGKNLTHRLDVDIQNHQGYVHTNYFCSQ
jgi:trafficking protein particle complex subunit 9